MLRESYNLVSLTIVNDRLARWLTVQFKFHSCLSNAAFAIWSIVFLSYFLLVIWLLCELVVVGKSGRMRL